MKKITVSILLLTLFFLVSIFILNMEVTTRQGIDYRVSTLKIPLYLKILNFYDRHFNYLWLVRRIVTDKNIPEEKVMAIFHWTINNISQQPTGLKVIDDHVWHIIVRGYGTNDQFSDVFTTLCNYAGIEAFFARLFNPDRSSQIPIAFAKVNGKWCLFYPYNAMYFVKKEGGFASIQDIKEGNWMPKCVEEIYIKSTLKYEDYLNNIASIDPETSYRWSRANVQSPIKRFLYSIVKKHSKN